MTHMGNFVSAKISLNESYERTNEFQTTKKEQYQEALPRPRQG